MELAKRTAIESGGEHTGTRLEHLLRLATGVELRRERLVLLGVLLESGQCVLERLEVGQDQLGVDGLDVVARRHLSGDMGDVVVAEHPGDLADRVRLADVRQELVAKTLALAGPSYDAGDVDELHGRRHRTRRLEHLRQHVETRIGYADDADVGLDRGERVVGREDLVASQGVEQGRLARVGEADDSDGERHVGLVFRIDTRDGITGSRYGERQPASWSHTMSRYEPPRPYQQRPPYQPYPPYPLYRPPPPWEGPPPTAVRYARNLIYAFLALNLARLVVWILDDPSADVPDGGGSKLPMIVRVTIAVFSTVVGSAVWVVAMIFIMRAARWARILVVGLCGAAVFGSFWEFVFHSLAESGDKPTTELLVVDIVIAVLAAIATGLLWTRESNRYFKSSGRTS